MPSNVVIPSSTGTQPSRGNVEFPNDLEIFGAVHWELAPILRHGAMFETTSHQGNLLGGAMCPS